MPNFNRGDAILVEGESGAVLTAFIDHISESDGYPFVTALVLVGSLHPLDKATTHYVDGYRHVSTPITQSGKRFCLVSEGAEAEAALRGHYALVTPEHPIINDHTAVDDIKPVDEAPPEVDPADTNADGTLSKAERKAWNKAHPDEPK